jgi:hypothetical protein
MHLTVTAERGQPSQDPIRSAAMIRSVFLAPAATVSRLRARTAARWLRRALSRLRRPAPAPAHPRPGEEERRYASALVATYGKLD